ncbi:MAG: cytochrome c oxidase subunit 3 [Microthrixaceae bacterium]|nr:cytochrome c oxidase subunit 3 [Microthrixaceae bacterium]
MALVPATLTAPPLPRRRQLLFGTTFAAAGVAMFQLALVGMYLAERAGHRNVWLTENAIPLTQPNMQLGSLVLGSIFVQWAVWAIARNERGQAYLGLGLTLLMGASVLNQTTFLWTTVALRMDQLEGPLFYAVTGTNFAIIAAAMLFVLLMGIRTLGGQFSSRLPDGVSAAALFWHVSVVLYSVVWLAVYIMK